MSVVFCDGSGTDDNADLLILHPHTRAFYVLLESSSVTGELVFLPGSAEQTRDFTSEMKS